MPLQKPVLWSGHELFDGRCTKLDHCLDKVGEKLAKGFLISGADRKKGMLMPSLT
jgi:hypothetical protein